MANSSNLLVTGHCDGSIRMWDVTCMNDAQPAEAVHIPSAAGAPGRLQTPAGGKPQELSVPTRAVASFTSPRASAPRWSTVEKWAVVQRVLLRAHQSPVTALYLSADHNALYSGDES